ncbi:MAG: PH domain-containing protein [Nakamurella sp.]
MTDLPLDPDREPAHDQTPLLTVRPRRIAIYASIGAVAVVAVGVFVAIKLRSSDTGVFFRTSDALSMVGLGLLFAGGLMLTARPRLRADSAGLRVRNIVGEKFVAWAVIQRIAFPPGSVWAQLELADDEVMSVMAIQGMDKQRAVDALREVRALHDRYAPPPTRLERLPLPPEDPNRPLGRLEIIDRQKAAQGGGKKRRR